MRNLYESIVDTIKKVKGGTGSNLGNKGIEPIKKRGICCP
jgi:hypothetical protein